MSGYNNFLGCSEGNGWNEEKNMSNNAVSALEENVKPISYFDKSDWKRLEISKSMFDWLIKTGKIAKNSYHHIGRNKRKVEFYSIEDCEYWISKNKEAWKKEYKESKTESLEGEGTFLVTATVDGIRVKGNTAENPDGLKMIPHHNKWKTWIAWNDPSVVIEKAVRLY